jgi:hypothetical protein
MIAVWCLSVASQAEGERAVGGEGRSFGRMAAGECVRGLASAGLGVGLGGFCSGQDSGLLWEEGVGCVTIILALELGLVGSAALVGALAASRWGAAAVLERWR